MFGGGEKLKAHDLQGKLEWFFKRTTNLFTTSINSRHVKQMKIYLPQTKAEGIARKVCDCAILDALNMPFQQPHSSTQISSLTRVCVISSQLTAKILLAVPCIHLKKGLRSEWSTLLRTVGRLSLSLPDSSPQLLMQCKFAPTDNSYLTASLLAIKINIPTSSP